jgi:hypothetical protein
MLSFEFQITIQYLKLKIQNFVELDDARRLSYKDAMTRPEKIATGWWRRLSRRLPLG